ncbi:MAG: hypothetical protein CL931_09145 [Deltaproteobacteria bacterium]|nr:hypothetical protein [Deltaproteobacteria bacterium]
MRVAAFVIAGILSLVSATTAPAQVLLDEADAAPVFPIGDLGLEYPTEHADHPAVDGLLPVEVRLRPTANGFTSADEDKPAEVHVFRASGTEAVDLDAEGLVAVLTAVVRQLHAAGYYGVDVRPASRDFDLVEVLDRRPAGTTALALEIRIGRVAQVRTIAAGDRVKSDWKIDNEIHERIRRASPLQPAGVADDGTTDLLDRRALEDYLHRLNRHSGRRVEAALSPGEEPGQVTLDYRVLEAKPWFVYGQGSNTGTNRTNLWQQRYGFTHRQLTDRDDILSIEYLNTGFDDVNAVAARYQAPFFGAERPSWMNHRRGDSEWLEWVPRDDIPWWGVDRLRWEAEFSWSLSEVGTASTFLNVANDLVRSESALYGARFIYEVYQHKNFFVDVWGGLRLQDLDVENRSPASPTRGQALLVVPRFGVHAERISELSAFTADFDFSAQVNEIEPSNREALGRDRSTDRYQQLGFALNWTAYLEPILNPDAWRDPSTHTSSTLAHELAVSFRSLYTLDEARTIPQANATLGGLYSVRGYPQSIAVGDDLYVATVEYRFHVPRALPIKREPLNLPLLGDFRASPQQVFGRPDWDLIFRAFVDVGHTERNDAFRPAGELDQTLLSAGVGAELQILSNIRARLDWAFALEDEERVNRNDRDGIQRGDSEIHALFSIVY